MGFKRFLGSRLKNVGGVLSDAYSAVVGVAERETDQALKHKILMTFATVATAMDEATPQLAAFLAGEKIYLVSGETKIPLQLKTAEEVEIEEGR